MTRMVRIQLIAFAVIAVLGVVYVGARYIRLDHMLGFGQYEVLLRAEHTGGAYAGAEVTYRGVPVGRVGGVDLTDDGVLIKLTIDSSSPPIPASARAVVANRSAIGEQYVDLQPDTVGEPYLREGSIIDSVTTPVPVEELIGSVDTLASTVDLTALSTTVTELGRALDGKGGDLRGLLESLNTFTESFREALPQTVQLIRDGRVALGTQAAQSDAIREFSAGLDQLAAQLRTSDPAVRRLIGTGTDAGQQIGALLDESGAALTTDLANLRMLLLAISPKFYALKPLLQMLPQLSIGASATAPVTAPAISGWCSRPTIRPPAPSATRAPRPFSTG